MKNKKDDLNNSDLLNRFADYLYDNHWLVIIKHKQKSIIQGFIESEEITKK